MPNPIPDAVLVLQGGGSLKFPPNGACQSPPPANPAILYCVGQLPAGDGLSHHDVTGNLALEFLTHMTDFALPGSDVQVQWEDGFVLSMKDAKVAGSLYSATRTRVSFWVGSCDMLEVEEKCLAQAPFLYAGGFDVAGVAACNSVTTENGEFRAEGVALELAEGLVSLFPQAEPGAVGAAGAVPGFVFGAEGGIDVTAGAMGTPGDLSVKFVVAGVTALNLGRVGGQVAFASADWTAAGGLDGTLGAMLLQVTGGPPVPGIGHPGELRYDPDPFAPVLYLRRDDGAWAPFGLF